MRRLDLPDDFAERVRASRQAQGLPPSVEDPATLMRVVTLMGETSALSRLPVVEQEVRRAA